MRPIHTIAREILQDWKNPYFAAKPYIGAMLTLNTLKDKYLCEDASTMILYFLSNASTWRGETARRIKKELNQMISKGNHKEAKVE